MREVLKIMGLRDWVHQLGWFLTSFLTFLWIAISMTALTHISFLHASNIILLFIYYFTFMMSLISMCFLISVFFSNGKIAAIVGPVVLVFGILPKLIFFNTQASDGMYKNYCVFVYLYVYIYKMCICLLLLKLCVYVYVCMYCVRMVYML